MDGRKVQAIVDWTPPTKVSELSSFLGSLQGPLTDLLNKEKK